MPYQPEFCLNLRKQKPFKRPYMNLKDFLNHDYFICRSLGTSPEPNALEQWLNHLETYQKSLTKERFFVGVPITLKDTSIATSILNWSKLQANTSIFFYINLSVHQTISSQMQSHSLSLGTDIHVLPDIDLNYGRFKDELWDLHLAGLNVYFHHVNEVKSFTKDLSLFQKLSNRGVSIGISANWSPTWRGNDVAVIQKLITELNVHFFNTESIDTSSEAFVMDQRNRLLIRG